MDQKLKAKVLENSRLVLENLLETLPNTLSDGEAVELFPGCSLHKIGYQTVILMKTAQGWRAFTRFYETPFFEQESSAMEDIRAAFR